MSTEFLLYSSSSEVWQRYVLTSALQYRLFLGHRVVILNQGFNYFRKIFLPLIALNIFSVPFIVFIKNKGGQTTSRQNLAHHLFLYIVFYWNTAIHSNYVFCLCTTRGRMTTTETVLTTKPKIIFTIWPFTENVCWSHAYVISP